MAGMFSGMLEMFQPMVLAMTAGSMVGPPRPPHLRAVRPADPPPDHRRQRRRAAPRRAEPRRVRRRVEPRSGRPAPVDLRARGGPPRGARRAPRPRSDGRPAPRSTSRASATTRRPSRTASARSTSSDPAALANLQEVIGSPDVILGAITSPEQDRLRPQLEALVAIVEGVVDHVVDVVGGELIAELPDAHRGAAPPARRGRRGRPVRRAPLRPRAQPGHLRPRQPPSSPACSSGPARTASAASGTAPTCSRPRPRSTPPASGSPASISSARGRSGVLGRR